MKKRKVGFIDVNNELISDLSEKFSEISFYNVKTNKQKIYDVIICGHELSDEEECMYKTFKVQLVYLFNSSYDNIINLFKKALEIKRELTNQEIKYINVINKFQHMNETVEKMMSRNSDHSLKVAYRVKQFADKLNTDKEVKLDLYMGALMHDVGKIKIDSKILSKSTKLNKKEYDEIKMHPIYGYEMLKGYLPESILLMIKNHHKRENNCGYPEDSDDVSVWTKIISLSDSFDAMTSDRVYNTQMTKLQGVNELLLCSKEEIYGGKGIIFDPYITQLFIKSI